MNEQDFIKKYGDEPQEVTRNYSTKSLGTNYSIKDSFNECCDNSYDAKIIGKILNFDVKIDSEAKTFTLCDNGTGVSDDTNLFKLGGTNKEKDKNKIGKFGIGVPGATSSIATKCIFNKTEMVEVIFESAFNGRSFEKHIAIFPNGDSVYGKTTYKNCDKNLHYTKITFTNVFLKNCTEIIDALEETFEEPLRKDLNITFNGRQLGKTSKRTFVGDEQIKTIMVGKFKTDVKYRIIGGDENKDSRNFEESGLRVYDKKSGRLLAKSNDLWKWYAGRASQPTICGLRCAIYIESSIESYKKFGIKPAKNGVTYNKYYSTDADFAELSKELASIYNQAAKTSPSTSEGIITLGRRTFQTTTMKLDAPYKEILPGTSYLIKKKYTPSEIANIINELITLKKKYEKKKSKIENNKNE